MNDNRIQEFKKAISNHTLIGCFSKTIDSSIIEAIGYSGMDFVIIDMEHGPVGFETLKHHLMAAQCSGLFPIVRVEGYESAGIGKALDLGALGIQVPSITSKDEAMAVIKIAKFSPKGERGVCRFVRAAKYGTQERTEYFKRANESIVILQLEGKEGLANFDSIIGVAGIDIIFIGPYDLSQSLEVPGEIEHPKVTEAIEGLIVKAKKYNITLGTFCDTLQQATKWKAMGIKYIAYSVDINIFIEKLKEIKNGI